MNMVNVNELKKVVAFLEANGWKHSPNDSSDEAEVYIKEGSIGVDICDDRIVFIGETGDFADIPLNYYTLLGYIYHHRLLHPVIPEFDDA